MRPASTSPEEISVAWRRSVTVLFAVTIFLGSALLFLVEPMVAKMLLPLLGGVPAVWNTTLVFFQLVLVAGYGWAHLWSSRLRLRTMVVAQLALFVVAGLTLPVALPAAWTPDNSAPILWVLSALVLAVGLPFFALSTASPVLQRWYSHTTQPKAGDPYFLYAASNAGSLIGLAAYPLILEPTFSLDDQSRVWGFLFVLLLGLMALTGLTSIRLRRADGAAPPSVLHDVAPTPVGDRPSQRLRWGILAAVPAALLLAVTHHLSIDVASVPLLWVVPLAIYLATFIVAFGANPQWLRDLAGRGLKVLAIPLAVALVAGVPLWLDLTLSLGVFAAAAMVSHGELAHSRPNVGRLTEYYMLVSVGGAIGGVLTAVVAPQVFPVVLEYPLAVAASLAVLSKKFWVFRWTAKVRLALVVAIVGVVVLIVAIASPSDSALVALLTAAAGAVIYVATERRWQFVAAIGLLLAAAPLASLTDAVFFDRSFFGTIRVEDQEGFRRLSSGSTLHGSQSLDVVRAGEPTTYYHRSGPVNDLFSSRVDGRPHSAAIVGLGAGSIAAYGRSGDRLVFLEIDPIVAEVASDPRYFTYLSNSEADIDIRLGDGRLLLEASAETFDLIVLDAFTSDAIPIHLLTLEAMAAYADHLSGDGIVAYHVSNRHVELRPLLGRQAQELGLSAVAISDSTTPEEAATGKSPSRWVAVSPSRSTLGHLQTMSAWTELDIAGAPLWTDDYSNLVSVLRFW
ncbi:MAG: fused MFS/spermidine synthase [Acidimicrobiia bacterium]|nr:fused MFS/spermidine synthase [Acidimicrobiia bacterium]